MAHLVWWFTSSTWWLYVIVQHAKCNSYYQTLHDFWGNLDAFSSVPENVIPSDIKLYNMPKQRALKRTLILHHVQNYFLASSTFSHQLPRYPSDLMSSYQSTFGLLPQVPPPHSASRYLQHRHGWDRWNSIAPEGLWPLATCTKCIEMPWDLVFWVPWMANNHHLQFP